MSETTAGTAPRPATPAGIAESDILRPEVHSWVLGSILDVAEEHLGKGRVASWMHEWGVDLRTLIESRAWVSWEFAELILARLATEAAPELVRRVGRNSMTPKHMGVLYPFFRTFGTIGGTYEQIAKSSGRVNKAQELSLERLGSNVARFRYRPLEGYKRTRTAYVCEVVAEQMAAVPTLFDMPPARVGHPACYHRGGDDCVFEVTWVEPPRRGLLVLLLLLGSAAGLAGGVLLGANAIATGWLAAATGLAAGATALGYRQHRDLASRIQDIHEHREALSRSVRENELRFQELLEAKAAVEQKVEERTRELRETSAQLARTLEEVRALDRAKTDFFSNVSHELRTPLTLLLAPLDDLTHGREPPGGREATFASMQRNAARLRLLISQLLDLAKVDAGGVRLSRTSVDLLQRARRVAEAFRPSADERGIELSVHTDGRLPQLHLDPDWIETALTNLVANSVRFAPREGHVKIHLADRGASVVLSVEDDGPGIPEEHLATIFDRFAQAGTQRTRRQGSGLGLALVREAARLHDGEVSVRSDRNRGTTFTLELPRVLARPESPASSDSDAIPPIDPPIVDIDDSASDGPLWYDGPAPDAPVALVVDDNPDIRRFIAEVLAVRYNVRLARHGGEALEAASELPPGVIITDVVMPQMDGLELTRQLRRRKETKATPILLVTARSELGQVLEGFDAGASDYLVKPFQARELLARTDVHVRVQRLVQQLAHQERLATLGSVAASVAHHVRNPLTVLVSGLPAMKKRLPGADASTQEMLDIMFECARRIERMTVDLLDLSRIDREDHGAFQPGQSLTAAVRLASATLPDTVQVVTDVDEQATIHGRPGDMNHVFMNLLDNATMAVGREGTVRVVGRVTDGVYQVDVADSGPGVDPSLGERVFDRHVSTREAGRGSGLGLAIAKDIVEQHGGSIALQPSDLGGACFTVRLPCETQDEPVPSPAEA